MDEVGQYIESKLNEFFAEWVEDLKGDAEAAEMNHNPALADQFRKRAFRVVLLREQLQTSGYAVLLNAANVSPRPPVASNAAGAVEDAPFKLDARIDVQSLTFVFRCTRCDDYIKRKVEKNSCPPKTLWHQCRSGANGPGYGRCEILGIDVENACPHVWAPANVLKAKGAHCQRCKITVEENPYDAYYKFGGRIATLEDGKRGSEP